MNRNFTLWWCYVVAFAAIGFWGSFLFIMSWPIAFLVGIVSVKAIPYRGIGGWHLNLAIAVGFMLGGLFPWFVMPFIPGIWWSGLLGDLIMSISFLLGVSSACIYNVARSCFRGTPGNPPSTRSPRTNGTSPSNSNQRDESQRHFCDAVAIA